MAQIWNRFRQLTFGSGKSAGRNSSGRITLFHRGGGAKRLQRRIDLKRSTTSLGIIERIEYDPNRSSRIALVRWKGGAHQRKCSTVEEEEVKRFESTAATAVRGPFTFSSIPSCVRDVFSPVKAMGAASSLSSGSSFSVPRMAVAGAMPPFFVCRKSEQQLGGKNNSFSLGEIRKWSTDSSLWAHRVKRKAAVSWQIKQDLFGPVGASQQHSRSKTKTKTVDHGSKNKVDCVPVTYIIASHQLEAGKMVMNWSKPAKA